MHMILTLMLSASMILTATPKPTAIQMVRAYATSSHNKLTERRDHGYVWIEMSDSDIFGVGRTEEEAAEDFLSCADVIDHEPANPSHAPAKFICPETDYCI